MKISSNISISVFCLAGLVLASCTTIREPRSSHYGRKETGKMSYYSIWTNGGTHTASGERLQNNANTAAHKTLPMGTMVKVTNLRNGRSEVVRITDRGPYIRGRIIDVTKGVAKKLDFIKAGVVPVEIVVVN